MFLKIMNRTAYSAGMLFKHELKVPACCIMLLISIQTKSRGWTVVVEWSMHRIRPARDSCSHLTALLKSYIVCRCLVESSGHWLWMNVKHLFFKVCLIQMVPHGELTSSHQITEVNSRVEVLGKTHLYQITFVHPTVMGTWWNEKWKNCEGH